VIARLGAMAFCALALGACYLPEAEEPLLVGTNVWPGYEPLYLARNLGLFGAAEIKLVELTSATEVMRAFENGQLDLAALTLDEALRLAVRGVPLDVVMALDFSAGADALMSRPSADSIAALSGKRIGVETTATGALMLARALESAGMRSADVTVVPLAIYEHVKAYSEGRIDAIVTFEPVRTELLALGARELFSSREIAGEIVDVLVAQKDLSQEGHAHVEALMKAWDGALKHLKDEPEDSVRQMTGRLGSSASAISAMFAGLKLLSSTEGRDWSRGEHGLVRSAERVSELLVTMGVIPPEREPHVELFGDAGSLVAPP